MKKNLAIFFLMLLIVFSFSGCGSKEKSQQKSNELFTVRIPTQTSFNEFDVADELGYFKEEGIQIKYIGVLTSGKDIAAALSGDNDVFTGHPNTVAKAILGGAKVKIVAPGMVDNPELVHMNYFVKEDGPIKSAKDLLNKKVKIGVSGRNSCTDLIALEWLSQNNIPKEQVEFVTMPDKEQEQALKKGLIDIADLHPPYIKQAQINGGVKSLFTSYQVVKNPAGGSSIRGFSEKFIKENPDVVRGFTKAIVKAHKWINDHPDESIKIVAKRTGMDSEKMSLFHYDDNEYIEASYIQAWFDLAQKHGQIPKGAIKASDIYTNEYNPYYKK